MPSFIACRVRSYRGCEPSRLAGLARSMGWWAEGPGLAPDITEAILDGRQPRDLTADKLLAHSRLPLGWHAQRTVLSFA